MNTQPLSRRDWREVLRERRRAIDPEFAAGASLSAARVLQQSSIWDAASLALFLANDGELDPRNIADSARRAQKRLFLPVVNNPESEGKRSAVMSFCEWREDDELEPNRFGIGEPPMEWTRIGFPEVILLPTVGWSGSGFRLGMGGGYYDRALAGMPASTRLVGLAYECQREDALDGLRENWDVPLHAMLTESALHLFR